MKVMRGHFTHLFAVLAILLLSAFLLSSEAFSKTVVKKTGECTREVTVNLELHSGGPRWTDAELAGLTEDQKKRLKDMMDNYSAYSDADLTKIGKEWGAEIESLWNGPTWDQLQGAKKDLGITDAELDKAVMDDVAGRAAIIKKLNDHLKKFGGGDASCAEINCCKIYFKVNVKVRKYADKADPDYDQIRVMKKGWRSSVTTHDDGLDHNQEGTSGKWGYDPDKRRDASAGHETGHLMGLDDEYTDAGGTKEGHEYDIMDWSYGFPQEDALRQILKLGGAECDCCPRPDDGYYTTFGRTFLVSSDAILTLNCPILKQTLADLEDQLSNVGQSRASITARMTLTSRINDQIKKVKKALEDCPKDTATTTGISTGTEGIPTAPFSFDTLVCVFYGGGTVTRIPLTPFGPYFPSTPENPATTPPDTRPPETTPGPQDTRPPETTPGPTDTRPPVITPGGKENPGMVVPIDTVIRRHPGVEHEAGVPEGGTFVTVPIEIVEMNLTSTEPITVTIPEDKQTEEENTGVPTPIFIIKAEQTVIEGGQTTTGPAEGTVQKLGFPPPPLPGTVQRTADATNNQHDKEPRQTVTDENGIGIIFADGFESGDTSSWGIIPEEGMGTGTRPVTGIKVDLTPTKSKIVYLTDSESPNAATGNEPGGQQPAPDQSNPGGGNAVGNPPSNGKTDLPESVQPYVFDKVKFGDTWGVSIGYRYDEEDYIETQLEGYDTQENFYRVELADDPYYNSKGTWGQPYDDQWAIKHVGFVEGAKGAWAAAGEDLEPVIVAVIDTGLDWNHADISWDNIWRNEDEIPYNGIDDDMNGYIDDYIGWDFQTNSSKPWDQDGHGTFIAGMIAAARDNGVGIAGMNPAAKIMVLKALNDFGHTRASFLAKAIKYAADNGARVINLSVGGDHLTYLEELAVKYAHDKGVVIVVASGNSGGQVADFGLSPYEEVIAVASTGLDDKRVVFSNWGPEIDVAAPGVDVLSLRARRTDLMRDRLDIDYEDGAAYVGEDKRYYRVSGTSFSAPMITAVASLIFAHNPDLTNVEVERMILQSARDVEIPGHDSYTGYGLLDAAAAISADPAFEIVADITTVQALQDEAGNYFVNVSGSANANDFAAASVQIGIGKSPSDWKEVATIDVPVTEGTLSVIPAEEFRTAPTWTIRIVVTHANGRTREEWYVLQLG